MEDKKQKMRVGLYIGNGPRPDDVEADMYVDMNGKDIGVFIGGVGKTFDKMPGLIEKASKENPKLSEELVDILNKYKKAKSNEEQKSVFGKIIDFGKRNEGSLVGAGALLLKIAHEWLTKN